MKGYKKTYHKFLNGLYKPKNLLILSLVVLLIPNALLCFTEHLHLLVCVCNMALPIAFYLGILTVSHNVGRNVWLLLPVVFLCAFQLVLLYLFGNGIISVDMFLNVVTTNSGEALELLGNIALGVVIVILLYVPILIWGFVIMRQKIQIDQRLLKKCRKSVAILFLAVIPFVFMSYLFVPTFNLKADIFPLNVCYNMYLSAERMYYTSNYHESSRNFRYNAKSTHDKNEREIYVLVIGETARADNWEIYGYNRNTNPLLKNVKGLIAFPYAFSQSNTTHKSVPMLLSSVSAVNFNHIYYQKSIITAFKEAGFRTAFYSNQARNHSFIDFFGMEADTCVFIKDDLIGEKKKHNSPDMKLLDYVREEIARYEGKLFIVLHTDGSHFKYNERYLPDSGYFKPDDRMGAEIKNKECLVNAYDNTIRYTDKFLYGLIQLLKNNAGYSAMLYTSDHGEDIFDNGSNAFLHSSPVPSYYQLHVPLLVWLSQEYCDKYKEIPQALNSNRMKFVSTSVSVFYSMLDIGGVSTNLNGSRHSFADNRYIPGEIYFLNDHNSPKRLDEIRLSAPDRKMFNERVGK